jgi:hypothetical protein
LAWDGHGLFDTDLEAWPDGPVERELFRVNKYERCGSIYSTDLPGADASRLTPRQRAIIDAVLEYYGDWTTSDLIDDSHTPVWAATREGAGRHEQGTPSNPIPAAEIRRWYARAALARKASPSPPAEHVGIVPEVTNEMVAAQIDRWRGVLDILATR